MWIFTRPWFIILDEFCLLLDIQTKKLLVVLSLATRIVTIISYYKKKIWLWWWWWCWSVGASVSTNQPWIIMISCVVLAVADVNCGFGTRGTFNIGVERVSQIVPRRASQKSCAIRFLRFQIAVLLQRPLELAIVGLVVVAHSQDGGWGHWWLPVKITVHVQKACFVCVCINLLTFEDPTHTPMNRES